MHRRTLAIRLSLALGVMLATAGLVLGTGTGLAAVHTVAHIYTPFTASGKPAVRITKTGRGACFTRSVAVNHEGTWRCQTKNLGYDPCFSSAKAKGIVLCPTPGPWSSSAVKIKLTKKLPYKNANKRKASTSGLPWALITTSGWKCMIDTGATGFVDGKRLNYFCSGTKNGLWGSPSRKSEPWKIYAAPPQAKKLSKKVGIKTAWF